MALLARTVSLPIPPVAQPHAQTLILPLLALLHDCISKKKGSYAMQHYQAREQVHVHAPGPRHCSRALQQGTVTGHCNRISPRHCNRALQQGIRLMGQPVDAHIRLMGQPVDAHDRLMGQPVDAHVCVKSQPVDAHVEPPEAMGLAWESIVFGLVASPVCGCRGCGLV
eukprot:364925-Chlamydomonas_euryale.AAC.2